MRMVTIALLRTGIRDFPFDCDTFVQDNEKAAVYLSITSVHLRATRVNNASFECRQAKVNTQDSLPRARGKLSSTTSMTALRNEKELGALSEPQAVAESSETAKLSRSRASPGSSPTG